MFVWPHPYGLDAFAVALPGTIPAPEPEAPSARLVLGWGAAEAVASHGEFWWAATEAVASHGEFRWGESLAARLHVSYGAGVARRLSATWGDTKAISQKLQVPWSSTAPVGSSVSLGWSLHNLHQAAARCRLGWANQSQGQVVQGGVELIAGNGRWLRPLRASVTLAEGSPLWVADITLGSAEDYAQIEMEEPLTLTLCGYTFSLRVDQLTEDEGGPENRRWGVKATSPLAWADTPYHQSGNLYFPAGTTAREAVEELLSPVAALTWQIPDWTLPAAGLVFTSTTPLAAARSIVEAIGGLLESTPDGAVVARRRYPVPPPEFAQAVPDLVVQDSEMTVRSTSVVHVDIVNRLTVADGNTTASSQDKVEFEADDTNALAGTVRAWPQPWREVRLVHTGRPEVSVVPKGIREWEVEETVEFKDGQASLGKPALSIVEVQWKYLNLGGVTLQDGGALTAAFGLGYSLATIRYLTRAYVWSVTSPTGEEVQFVLEDDDE